MPWGKHRGLPMQDVPAGYLHYLWAKGMENETKSNPVADYVKRNMSALEKEYPNGIW